MTVTVSTGSMKGCRSGNTVLRTLKSLKSQSEIAGLADALKKSMDEDQVVTPMNLATLTPTIGLDGQKSKELVSTFDHGSIRIDVRVGVGDGVRIGVHVDDRGSFVRL